MALDPKTYIESLYSKYNDGSGYIRVVQDGSDYVVTIVGSYGNRGRYKIRRYDINGRLIYERLDSGTNGVFQPPANIPASYQSLFSAPMTNEGIDKTPIIDQVAPPPPPFSPNLNTITNDYNVVDGYGELDIKAAIEYVTGDTLEDVAPVNRDYLNGNSTNPMYWQDQLDRAKAPEAWNAGYEGQGIIVAVIDTGIDLDHVDLDDNLWVNPGEIPNDGIDNDGNGFIDDVHGWNTAENSNDIQDEDGHGTHVSGTIAAEDNGIGIIGVAPKVKIMTVVPFQDFGGELGWRAYNSDIAEAIYYAVDNGAHVINMSLGGGYTPSLDVITAIDFATSQGVVVVMAAGNDYNDDPVAASGPAAPAVYASEAGIAVGSVDRDGNMSYFSNRAGGPTDFKGDGAENPLYVTANGQVIYSTKYDGTYELKQGTSMACPVVAAGVAVLLSAQPNLTPEQIRVVLANTTF